MKTPSTPPTALQARPRRRLTKKQRGVAIITVLAVIVLMSALVLSFFQMSQSEQVSSKINADILRSYSMRDTAINMAIGQLREATAPSTAAVLAGGNALWTSQPGMIRTFDNNGKPAQNFKLYSAQNMVVSGGGGPTEDTRIFTEDQALNWKTDTASWVDLNKPIYRPRSIRGQELATATESAVDVTEAIYPIMDPASFDPKRTPSSNVEAAANPEGLWVADNSALGVVPGVAVPMPVRWLYLLEDGTIGFLNGAGVFTVPGSGSAPPSVNNPIVGRMAFWADDESCKININTASEGVFWDTPRCDTDEERSYANCPPSAGEYQRYPGHPAGVCLSSVLFPFHRFYGNGPILDNTNPVFSAPTETQLPKLAFDGGTSSTIAGTMNSLTSNQLLYLWDLAPKVSYRRQTGAGGGSLAQITQGTLARSNPSDAENHVDVSQAVNPDDHLYTSLDEMLFRAAKKKPEDKRTVWSEQSASNVTGGSSFNGLKKETLLQRLNYGRFLLTTKSSAPETNVYGHPRISLWPVNIAVPGAVALGDGAAGAKYTAFDTVIGLTGQLDRHNYYYIVRDDAFSRHAEFSDKDSWKGHGQNEWLHRYLRSAFGDTSFGVTQGKLPGVPGTNTFFNKYQDNSGAVDSSDMSNILLNMLDYIRMTNLSDPALQVVNRYGYDGAFAGKYGGQITAYCGCKGGTWHAAHWALQEEVDPKGVGRTFTPTRIHWVMSQHAPATVAGVDYADALKTSSGTNAANYTVYELGLVVEGSCPAQGLASITPQMSCSLGAGVPSTAAPSVTNPIPKFFANDSGASTSTKPTQARRQLTLRKDNQSASSSFDSVWPIEVNNYGGSQGFRAFGNDVELPTSARVNTNVILFKPFAIPQNTPFTFVDGGNPKYDESLWRLMVYDSGYDGISTGNVIQCFYFHFGQDPAAEQVHLQVPSAQMNSTLSQTFAQMFKGGASAPTWKSLLQGNYITVSTMVLPAADFHTSICRRVMGNNRSASSTVRYSLTKTGVTANNDYASSANVMPYGVSASKEIWNSFVPVANFGSANSYQIYDPGVGLLEGSTTPARRTHLALTTANGGTPNNDDVVPGYATMDYPYNYKDYQHFLDQAQRKRRGSMDPAITGDWDNGVGNTPDGSYINKADEGDLRTYFNSNGTPNKNSGLVSYFADTGKNFTTNAKPGAPNPELKDKSIGAAAASPNRMVKGPVQLGSLSTGAATNTYWQSLLFRPDPFGGDPNPTAPGNNPNFTMDNRHFGGTLNSSMPKDHLLLDFFWMPVVEPYALSDTFSTKGKINMNYKIFPFNYIHRATALHALFKAEKFLAIPTSAGSTYKTHPSGNGEEEPAKSLSSGSPEPKRTWRRHIDATKTLWQFEHKFDQQVEFLNDVSHVFRTPSEICELWLIPESESAKIVSKTTDPFLVMRNFWLGISVPSSGAAKYGTSLADKATKITDLRLGHRLTGDNTKEAPYANLYPRLTTKSNVFKVHFTVQTIQKARSTDVNHFVPDVDLVTSEYRGSAVIERTLDMTSPTLRAIDYLRDTTVFTDPKKRLDYFYNYRITEIKQFAP